jgi:hypothetical protein
LLKKEEMFLILKDWKLQEIRECLHLMSIFCEGRNPFLPSLSGRRSPKTHYKHTEVTSNFYLDFCEGDWNLTSGFFTCKASVLLLEPFLQSILLWF